MISEKGMKFLHGISSNFGNGCKVPKNEQDFDCFRSLLTHRAILVDELRKGGNVDSLSKFLYASNGEY